MFLKRRGNENDNCASYRHHLITVLLKNVVKALKETGIKHLAIAGGVSANSELRKKIKDIETEHGIKTFIPPFEYCTDNAAMIGIAAYYKFQEKNFAELSVLPQVRMSI